MIFSKFHHTFDREKNLRFFFAIDLGGIPKYDGLLNVEVLRSNLLPPFKRKTDHSKQVSVDFMEFNVGNEGNYLYVSGIDAGLKLTEEYYYTVTVRTKMKNRIETTQGTEKTNLHSSNIPSGAYTTTHKYSSIMYDDVIKLSKDIKLADNNGFSKVSKELFEKNSIIREEIITFEKKSLSGKKNRFVEINDERAPRKSSGLNVNTVLVNDPSTLSEKQYVSFSLACHKDEINYEYLDSYGNNITIENWKSLNMEEIKDKGLILVRGKNVEPYENKYFFLGE